MQHIIAICTFGDTNESSTRDDAKNTAKDEAKDKSKEALSAKLPSNRCQAEDGKGAKKGLWGHATIHVFPLATFLRPIDTRPHCGTFEHLPSLDISR